MEKKNKPLLKLLKKKLKSLNKELLKIYNRPLFVNMTHTKNNTRDGRKLKNTGK